ncbi:uncharacterized protein LOC117099887 [Anneissia japonica]|uniref:uncharacterized protein LOC117099887 n=1 Tax=Anneissia japonica TaxID=1529436 RepID=UPI00142584D8|nr:uncharacterized protein LOC117099887 [Anneissia japonica]
MRAKGVLILGILFFVHHVTTAPLEDENVVQELQDLLTEENEFEEANGESEVAVEDPDADVLDPEEDEEPSYIDEEAGMYVEDDDGTAGASEPTQGLPEVIVDLPNTTTTTTEAAEPTPIPVEEATLVISAAGSNETDEGPAAPVVSAEDHAAFMNGTYTVSPEQLLEIQNGVCGDLLDKGCTDAEVCKAGGCTQLRCHYTRCVPNSINQPLLPGDDDVDTLNDEDTSNDVGTTEV